ncbi:MAG: hypothetical protein R3F05_09690 [Planctomycetota bacterium]
MLFWRVGRSARGPIQGQRSMAVEQARLCLAQPRVGASLEEATQRLDADTIPGSAQGGRGRHVAAPESSIVGGFADPTEQVDGGVAAVEAHEDHERSNELRRRRRMRGIATTSPMASAIQEGGRAEEKALDGEEIRPILKRVPA